MTVSGASQLIALRTVIGLGAALVVPATLSTITGTFPPARRGTAAELSRNGKAYGIVADLTDRMEVEREFPHLAPPGQDDLPALADMLGTVSTSPNRRPANGRCRLASSRASTHRKR
jgi:hypothetical protein